MGEGVSRSTIEERRGYNKFVPVLGGDGTKIAPPRDLFDQPLGERSYIRGKLADHVEDPVALSPEGVILVTSPGTESSYPRPPQSLKHSRAPDGRTQNFKSAFKHRLTSCRLETAVKAAVAAY